MMLVDGLRRRFGHVVGLLALCLVSTSSSDTDTDTDSDTRYDVILTARCRVRCLSRLQVDDVNPFLSKYKSVMSLQRCLTDTNCTSCMKPCSQPLVSTSLCQRVCERETPACQQSCLFLRTISSVHAGECPAESAAEDFAAACVKSCEHDGQCQRGLKCCSNGCGKTCQRPINQYKGLPSVPDPPSLHQRLRGGTVDLRWQPVTANDSSPILYIIDTRWNVGRHHDQGGMIPWQQIAQTTGSSQLIRDLTPGHWYEYRISAVNIHGSRGVSPTTKAFSLNGEPQAPSAPQNLTEGDTKIAGSRISVVMHWMPPKHTHLPVTRYKVFWSKRLRNVTPQLVTLKEHRKVLSGDQHFYELPDLETDTEYFVQVQAICQYGDSRLKSTRASVYVHTFPLPKAHSQVLPTPVVIQLPLPTPPSLQDLTVNTPYFQNGLLKANLSWTVPTEESEALVDKVLIHWTPDVCIADTHDNDLAVTISATTHETSFILYDLRFDCRYLVRVQPVSEDGAVGEQQHQQFKTPTCTQVEIVGDMKPECNTDIPRTPDEPVNFEHSFLISSSNITARVTWQPPASDTSLTGYRLVYGQAVEDIETPVLDKTTALTKVLPKSHRAHSIANLPEGVTYIVRLQALSRIGSGRIASLHFTTPWLQVVTPPPEPTYKHLTQLAQESSTTSTQPTPRPGEISIHRNSGTSAELGTANKDSKSLCSRQQPAHSAVVTLVLVTICLLHS